MHNATLTRFIFMSSEYLMLLSFDGSGETWPSFTNPKRPLLHILRNFHTKRQEWKVRN